MEGQLVHFELPAQDSGRAKSFWSSLFGWKYREFEGPIEYSMLDGNEPGGAIYPSQEGERGAVIYFGTDDTDKSLARIVDLGGEIVLPAEDTPYGRLAQASDPTGSLFKLVQGN